MDDFEVRALGPHRIVSARAAPLALTTMKANFLAAEKMGFADYIGLESEKHMRLFQTDDTTEAFKAFVEKRAPVFKGR